MITNSEFERLIALSKKFIDADNIVLPKPGKKLDFNLSTNDKKEDFVLNIRRGRINLDKITYQNLYRKYNMPLVRIDLDGPRHQNPDGNFIGFPHIHIYQDGFADKWAYELDEDIFTDASDLVTLLKEFMIFCNIENIPILHQISF